MEPVTLPRSIGDPLHILLWSADEIAPFIVSMLAGILIDQFIPCLARKRLAVPPVKHI